MKISVLIIAHNEEKNIANTISSALLQDIPPDEIVVVVHNSTDNTKNIASGFQGVRVVEEFGEKGALFARIRGFKEVSGDIICCLDGDTRVTKNWVKELIRPFDNHSVVAVGSDVRIHGTFLDYIGSIFYFYTQRKTKRFSKNSKTEFFFGASFAVKKEAYEKIGGFDELKELSNRLSLKLLPDDWFLGIKLSKIGKIVITLKTTAHVTSKCKNSWERLNQGLKQTSDGKKLYKYFFK